MKTETLEYTHQDIALEAFVAHSEKPSPTVLIFHAWKGRDDFALEKAEWISSLGYIGVALDMYGKGVLGLSTEENSKLMEPFIQDRNFLLSRMKAGLLAAQGHPLIKGQPLAAMGFCFGGLCALDLARSGAAISGAISVHGLLNPPPTSPQPKGKILALHGYEDPMVPPESLVSFQEEMKGAGADWQVHAYGKTLHAFTNPSANDPKLGTVYSPTAEKRALQSEVFYQA